MREMEEKQPRLSYSSSSVSYRSAAGKGVDPTRPTTGTISANKKKGCTNTNLVHHCQCGRGSRIPSSSSYYIPPKDSEAKRKQRLRTYKAYAVEGKVKASIRSTIRWVKTKYVSIVYGY